jgi:mono/diheme cytochrome c family protein
MRLSLALLALLTLACAAHAQHCSSSYSRSYGHSYSYAPAYSYGAPTYHAPAKVYKDDYVKAYEPAYVRFVLALPVVNLPSYGAAYAPPHEQQPQAQPQPQQQQPTPQASPQSSQMQQLLQQQTQMLQELKKVSDKVDRIEQRVDKLERVRSVPQPEPQPQRDPKEERQPDEAAVISAFKEANTASCAACHTRTNAKKYGGDFVFTEDDGSLVRLTAEQREAVEHQMESGKMPLLKSKRATEAGVKALTRESGSAIFAMLQLQRAAGRGKK